MCCSKILASVISGEPHNAMRYYPACNFAVEETDAWRSTAQSLIGKNSTYTSSDSRAQALNPTAPLVVGTFCMIAR